MAGSSPVRVSGPTASVRGKDGSDPIDDPATDRPLPTPRPRRPQPGPSRSRRVVSTPKQTDELAPTPAAAVPPPAAPDTREAPTPALPTVEVPTSTAPVAPEVVTTEAPEVVTPAPAVAATPTTETDLGEGAPAGALAGVDPVRQELVERARAGDAAAFGEIYELYVESVFRYVYYRTSDRALAEDLTSETFLRAWRRIDSFTWQGRDIGAWLVRISRNLLYDNVKSSRYRLEVTTADLAEPSEPTPDTTEQQVLDADAATQLLAGISRLSPEQQECLVLRFFEGLSVAETAVVMDRREGAVKALQHRAVRRLGLILPADLAS